MDIVQIRKKYQTILQQDPTNRKNQAGYNPTNMQHQNQADVSEREWINIARRQKQKRMLTETSKQNRGKEQIQRKGTTFTPKKSGHKLSTEQTVIDLKQKLAQSILNCSRKDAELQEFQNLVVRKNQQIKMLQKSIAELKKVINEKDSIIFQSRLNEESSIKQIHLRDSSLDGLRLENQLLQKHIQNYARELEQANLKWKQEQKRIEKADKEKEKADSFKSKIQKLKDDVKRLQFLLSDNQLYAPLLISLQGKHFLGRPNKQSKELQYWYPESLINGVQQFLKKEQVGHGNKAFSESLTKFIYGLMERSQKTGEKKCKNRYTSRIKQIERKKNHIFNMLDTSCEIVDTRNFKSSRNSRLNASSLRKNTQLNGNCSQLKTREFSVCLEKSLCMDRQAMSSAKYRSNYESKVQAKKPFIIQSLQKSVNANKNHKHYVAMELIESFCKGVQKLFKLENRTLAQQKVVELSEWLRQSIQEVYDSGSHFRQENFLKQTGKWNTVADI